MLSTIGTISPPSSLCRRDDGTAPLAGIYTT
jgi:hypothetical protein